MFAFYIFQIYQGFHVFCSFLMLKLISLQILIKLFYELLLAVKRLHIEIIL